MHLRLLFICYLTFTSLFSFSQATLTWSGNGDNVSWTDAANWNLTSGSDADLIPDSDDDVVLNTTALGAAINLTITGSQACNSLTLTDDFWGITLNFSGATFQINGIFSTNDVSGINTGAFALLEISTSIVRFAGGVTLDANAATNTFNLPNSTVFFQSGSSAQEIPAGIYGVLVLLNSGSKTFGGVAEIRGSALTVGSNATSVDYSGSTIYYNGSSGNQTIRNYNFNNVRIGNSGSTIILNSSGTIGISGSLTFDGTNALTTTGSTVELNGSSAQALNLSSRSAAATFNNLVINNPAGVTLTGNLNATNLTGNLTISQGTFNAQTNTVASASGTFEIASGATFQTAATSGFPTGFSTYTLNSGSNFVYSADGAQNISGSNVANFDGTYGNLSLSGNGTGTKTAQGNINIRNVLDVQVNDLAMGANTLTILSDASGSGAIDAIDAGGSITGSVTVQRFLNDGAGWYVLGSQHTNAGFSDWLDDFNITSNGGDIAGADFQTGFNSLQYYDESAADGADSGWTPVPAVNAGTIDNGLGYASWQQNDNKSTLPKTITLTGTVNGSGGVTQALSFTNNTNAADGLNLLANPYAAPIDFTACTFPNLVGGSVQVLDASAGSWSPPASNIIAMGEGFYAEVSAAGTATFPQSAKSPNTADQFNKNATVNGSNFYNRMLSLEIHDGAHSNKTFIRFESDATVNRDLEYDLRKMDNMFGRMDIATVADSLHVVVNGVPDTGAYTIPVAIYKNFNWGQTKTFSLDINNIQAQLDRGLCISLEDTVAGLQFPLTSDTTYSFSMNENYKGIRIFLHVNNPIQTESQNASCRGLADGVAIAQGSGQGAFTYTWRDMQNTVVRTAGPKPAADTLSAVRAGLYTVEIEGNATCPTLKETVDILEPLTSPYADFVLSHSQIPLGEAIYTTNRSAQAKDFNWNMGDGNTYEGIFEPIHRYDIPGVYAVSLVASLAEQCPDTATRSIEVLPDLTHNPTVVDELSLNDYVSVYNYFNQAAIEFNLAEPQHIQVNVLNVSGQLLYSETFNQASRQLEYLNLPLTSGIYLVQIVGEKDAFTERLLVE